MILVSIVIFYRMKKSWKTNVYFSINCFGIFGSSKSNNQHPWVPIDEAKLPIELKILAIKFTYFIPPYSLKHSYNFCNCYKAF